MSVDHSKEPTPFWVVRRVRDDDKVMNSRPFHRHISEHDAHTEAERLAQTHPGVRFMVLAYSGSHYAVPQAAEPSYAETA